MIRSVSAIALSGVSSTESTVAWWQILRVQAIVGVPQHVVQDPTFSAQAARTRKAHQPEDRNALGEAPMTPLIALSSPGPNVVQSIAAREYARTRQLRRQRSVHSQRPSHSTCSLASMASFQGNA